MMNYKDTQNNLHFIDPDYVHLLPEGCVQITEDEAEALRPKPTALTYKDLRAQAYPPIAEQLDDIFHNGLSDWKANIKEIKSKYPKK